METYTGHVRTPADAILLFEACRLGLLPRVQRRLSEKERQQIKSGSVFVWDEREAGMRRWTDGKSWSASRVSGSFLTYREMEGKRGGNSFTPTPAPKRPNGRSPSGSANGDSETEGPDGYRYKPDGLLKQSFSITTANNQHLHLISYFSRSHSGNLQQPTNDPQLRRINIPKGMYPESSVNENQSIPAVTRSPMPESQYSSGQQPMASQSPFSRPGPSQQMPVLFQAYPGPPTPPYHSATYFIPQHIAYQQGGVFYSPHAYHPPPQAMTPLDRLPPHMSNGYPPGSHPAFQGHPHHPHALPPQYLNHLQSRAMQVPDPALQQQQQHQQLPGGAHYPHQNVAPQHQHQHQHQHQQQYSSTSLPEQGPVLPALNGINNPNPTSPQPNDQRSTESLAVPDVNNASQSNAPSPSRTIPNIHTLLNDHADPATAANPNNNNANTITNNPPSNSNAVDTTQSSVSRSGSRSPANSNANANAGTSTSGSQRPPSEMTTGPNSLAADHKALSRLNSTFQV